MNEIEFCFDASSRKSGNRTARAGVPLSNFATLVVDPSIGITVDAPTVMMTEAPTTLITETSTTQVIHTPGTVLNENPNEMTADELPPAHIGGDTMDPINEVYVL